MAWGFADADAGAASVIKLAALLDWLVVAAAALVLLALRVRGRLGVGAFVVLALALTTFDLFKAGMGYNPAIPQSHAVQPATPALRYLQDRSPQRFSALQVTSALSLVYPFVPNTAMRYDVQDVRGYVIPTEERYFDLWRDVIHRKDGCYYLFCTQAPPADDRAYRALALLCVGNLLQHPRDPPLAGQRPAYEGADARIYRNPAALPRAFLVDRQQVVDGAKAARNTVTAAGFPARSVAVTEQRIAGIPEGTATSSPGAANIADYTAERVAVDTRSNRRSLLVLTDNWYPGWKAKVDGHDAPVERVDYLIRGVTVPAGAHRVEFRYDPASWRAGWIVSLLALVAVGAAAAIGWRRRRAEPRHRGATTGMFEA